MHTIKNWSENIIFTPKEIHTVENETEIIKLIQTAYSTKRKLRTMGSAHSFVPLMHSNDLFVRTEKLQGIISVDKIKKRVRVHAGTKLCDLGQLLFNHGLAQENLGDIDVQSIGGATATGTHGTGMSFGSLSTQISALTLINGKGERIECSEEINPDVFKAAQISLGALGVITEIELKVQNSYILQLISRKEKIEFILENLENFNHNTRNFEFLWFPHTDIVQTKFSNIVTDSNPIESKFDNWRDDFLENKLYNLISMPTRLIPKISRYIAKMSTNLISTSKKINWSHKVYTLPRTVLFHEMEYNVPYETFKTVKKECLRVFKQKNFSVHFPTENRFVKGDDIFLSPAYNRDSAYIAFHTYKGTPYKEYFKTMEEICVHYGGRPHWAKMHTKDRSYFEKNYPKWGEFLTIREKMDPDRIFVTEYMNSILF